MKHSLIIAAMCLALLPAACTKRERVITAGPHSHPVNVEEFALLKEAEERLRNGVGWDKDETQVRNLYAVEGNAVCGEINWTDSTHRLRGFVPFMYRYGFQVKEDSKDRRSRRFAQVWTRLCKERNVIAGVREPLPEATEREFAHRVELLEIAGANARPERVSDFYTRHLNEIEADYSGADLAAAKQRAADLQAALDRIKLE
jgi:hypothetical protein